MEDKTIHEMLEKMGQEICDNYCRYMHEGKDYKDEVELYEKHCDNCPLTRYL